MANALIPKQKETAGADERTPSKSQYFSWINNTNEGSTELNTLINIDYFKWLKRAYNMQLDIYAWDAGNLDGASGTYEKLEGEKLKGQYPNGYAPIGKAIGELGAKLGVWCGPDGFGDTKESEKARHELMVSLCRDYHFGLFKMDGVCGTLRPEKREAFVNMMKECRFYSPELILLNHRLDFGEEGEKYATTFLLGGEETYVDVHITNEMTAPHHRAFMFRRKGSPGLVRLTEDHGVCLSSCLDYFEDDFIYQAFNRCFVLAPEIYANPWLIRDDEQAHLARIYNLHRKYRAILVDGMELDESIYGKNAVARGTETNRFIATGNGSWKTKTIKLRLDGEIGLAECEKVFVCAHHPFERVYGEYNYGDTVEIEAEPFRALLLHICDIKEKPAMLTGCEYEVLHETADGTVDKIKIVSCGGAARLGEKTLLASKFDNTQFAPVYLGRAEECAVPENERELLETAYFTVDADSLEARSVKRSGATKIPEVQRARDAFFNQRTYVLRGCESRYAFDGNRDTYFDSVTKTDFGKMRVKEGCLRVDFGDIYDADSLLIEYFDFDEPNGKANSPQNVADYGEFGTTLDSWQKSGSAEIKMLGREQLDVIITRVHNIVPFDGSRKTVSYAIGGKIRYFTLDEPMDRIFKIALIKDGKELNLNNPRVTNVMPSAFKTPVVGARSKELVIEPGMFRDGSYLSIALEGRHGVEGATVVAEIDGKFFGCPDRAASYQANCFECPSRKVDSFYTYYLPLTRDMTGKKIKLYTLCLDKENLDFYSDIYLCCGNGEIEGEVFEI